jgi:hypothetical protein
MNPVMLLQSSIAVTMATAGWFGSEGQLTVEMFEFALEKRRKVWLSSSQAESGSFVM